MARAARVLAPASERALWSERLGHVIALGRCDAWVHAASLGESLAVAPLLRELSRLRPDAEFFLTATTLSGRRRLVTLGPPTALAPLDAPQSVERFFAAVQPKLLLVIETELWPQWLLRARALNIPVAVVSARLSRRSVARYRQLGREFRGLIAGLGAVLCQSEGDRDRWLAIGAREERTRLVGNLKNDGLHTQYPDRMAARRALGLDPERPVFVLGSLRPGEARRLARAWATLPVEIKTGWQVVAIPRHPRWLNLLRAEAQLTPPAPAVRGATPPSAWRWIGELGVLAGYYAAAEVAFVGGSLMPFGGHNPLEPAACGAAVVMGPHVEAQAAGVHALARRRAIRIVATPSELEAALLELLGDERARASSGAAALEVVALERGAARRAVEELVRLGLWRFG